MKTLQELYEKHKRGDWPDKGSVHSYIEVYEELLAPYRATARNGLEIGLMSGESLRMWTDYFAFSMYGMDCDIKPIGGMADLTEAMLEGYKVVIGDATSPFDVAKHFVGMKFDVVIEDANHDVQQQLDIYNNLKSYLSKGSIYIIEDVQEIDATRELFENIDPEKKVTILDRRHIKNRYDDVLVIIQDK
jgi:hypothetical protein